MSAALLHIFLQALALVESGDNPQARGAAGELGRFQMRPAVVASCGGYGEKEAAHYARWLELQLVAAGADPLPFNLALAWNAGPGATVRGRAPISSYDYARRVVATMERLSGESLVLAYRPDLAPKFSKGELGL